MHHPPGSIFRLLTRMRDRETPCRVLIIILFQHFYFLFAMWRNPDFAFRTDKSQTFSLNDISADLISYNFFCLCRACCYLLRHCGGNLLFLTQHLYFSLLFFLLLFLNLICAAFQLTRG